MIPKFTMPEKWKEEDECFALLEKVRWDGTVTCPYCDQPRPTKYKGDRRYHCNTCNTPFSPTAQTVFSRKRIYLKTWFHGLTLFCLYKDISIRTMAKEISTSNKTAALMLAKLNHAMHDADDRRLINAILEEVIKWHEERV